MMRRHLFRLLRLRNLVMLTIMVALLYLVRMLSDVKVSVDESNVSQEALKPLAQPIGDIPYFVPKSRKKKDWHNYTQIEYERKRVGIGEQGLPAYLSEQEAELKETLYAVNGFNGALSDKIPLNRSLPDIRHPGCKETLYLESLPSVSVVVPFHNEHWSTLLRTAHSVLHRSPEHLIKEIFLVDDASTKEFLGAELDAYVAAHMPKVSVVRLAERGGLIAARLAGARRSTADVLLFLDSHTEANVNWLPPLLEPIAEGARNVTCPYIDVLAHDTLHYRAQDGGARGAFDWELYYKRLPLLPQDEAAMPRPFPSPVMAGGLFAISRAFFWELGGYDPGLEIWGGEQYELSFKIWQCGGRLVDVPCARVGHIYRKFAPFPNPGRGDFVARNYRRVAEVWMDEYAEHVYARRPATRAARAGDLARQRHLRARLRCRSFRWYMTQIAFDLIAKYPPVEPEPFAEGRIRPAADASLCADAARGAQLAGLRLAPCARAAEGDFLFSWHKDIRSKSRSMCWDLPDAAPRRPVRLYPCHRGGGNQLWRYRPDTKQIKHGLSDNCLEYSRSPPEVYINRCAPTEAQRWAPERLNLDMLDKWDSMRDRVTGPEEPWVDD